MGQSGCCSVSLSCFETFSKPHNTPVKNGLSLEGLKQVNFLLSLVQTPFWLKSEIDLNFELKSYGMICHQQTNLVSNTQTIIFLSLKPAFKA